MILVTGGAGYIGSHTCVALLEAGHNLVVLDNFANSSRVPLQRVQQICRKTFCVVEGDIRDEYLVERTLRDFGCTSVIHFAGQKSIEESVADPLKYYDHNVIGSLRLLSAMKKCGVRNIVFSSSATVYGSTGQPPCAEDHPLAVTNPYGRTKLTIEEILRDLHHSDPSWHIAILRYFNPVGAHNSAMIGEDPVGIPSNLVPFIAQVAIGLRKELQIWGNDYPTPDGTGVRDYVHVTDLALGHVAALEVLKQQPCLTLNLGTGRGYSVLEVVKAFEEASGRQIRYAFGPRRPGDLGMSYADTSRAKAVMGWEATKSLKSMCLDHWRWQVANPNGYKEPWM